MQKMESPGDLVYSVADGFEGGGRPWVKGAGRL
jgi:hypothetical protein